MVCGIDIPVLSLDLTGVGIFQGDRKLRGKIWCLLPIRATGTADVCRRCEISFSF